MNTEESIPKMNESGGFFGAELATHERIRSVQSQIRIAIQNHHLLFTRSQAFPKDADLENHMTILQDLILSLGRTQLELMYQFKIEVKEKHGVNNLNNIMGMYLGWPDRHEMHLYKPKENGASDGDRRGHILKKKPLLPHSVRPKVKMQSLLKVNLNRSILPTKKEADKVKGSAKLTESPNSVINSAKKLQSVLKARNEKLSQAKDPGDADLKESLSSGVSKIEEPATSIEDVSQESFLGFFGLVHKDKSKNMVVHQKKRKRRSAAAQSNFHGDFSYFQAKRVYTKRAAATSAVLESPTSSQSIVDVDESDRLSLASTDKPSGPTSPEILSSQDLTDAANSQELTAGICELAEGNTPEKIDGTVEPNSTEACWAKMADNEKSDRVPDEFNQESNALKDSIEVETNAQILNKEFNSQIIIDDENCQPAKRELSNSDQTDEQGNKGELINSIDPENCIGELNMETSEAEILLRYSPETDSVEILQVKNSDVQGHKLTPSKNMGTVDKIVLGGTRTYHDESVTSDKSVTPGNLTSPGKPAFTPKSPSPLKSPSPIKSPSPLKTASPLKSRSPLKSASSPKNPNFAKEPAVVEAVYPEVKPVQPDAPGESVIPNSPDSPDSDNQSDDLDPTSFMPANGTQNSKSSRPSKANDVCSVCFQNTDSEPEKCSMCGEDFHKECAPSAACPICQASSSTISSIVGVNTSSRLTSTDCSEMIKRYLDGGKQASPQGQHNPQ